VKVLPGEYFVHDEDILIMTTLGSCIAACLWDREKRVGGMNHFMLPDGGAGAASGRYGSLRDGPADQRADQARRHALDDGGQGLRRRRRHQRHEHHQRRRAQHRSSCSTTCAPSASPWCPRTCWTSTRARSASCRPAARPWSSAWPGQHRGLVAQDAAPPQRVAPVATAGGSVDLF
jgi:hypothetical protein